MPRPARVLAAAALLDSSRPRAAISGARPLADPSLAASAIINYLTFIFERGSHPLETVACNLCGSTRQTLAYRMPDRLFFPEEFFDVVACDECGFGFVNPRPTPAEMARYYPAAYFQSVENAGRDRYFQRRYAAEAAYLRPIEKPGAHPLLLDVGCAGGDFPRFMAARGWLVEGVEVSASAGSIHDFPVYRQEFHEIPGRATTYDAVTAWAVLEHVHDPLAYFRKAAQVLKPGGLFVFLVTNFQSLASRHLFVEDVPRHLNFFTRSVVGQYLEHTGFRLLREDNGRNIYKAAPVHWLPYQIHTRLRGREFTYADVPLTKREYLRAHQLARGWRASLRYALYSPASVMERLFFPLIETLQILRESYGISTYVAQKR
jgi:SAM-dependent methyltransferase